MQVHSLDHLNLTVANLDESITWYRKVFGFQVVEQGQGPSGPWAIIRSGDAMLCIYQEPDRMAPRDASADGPLPHVIYHWGLRITDRDAWLDKVAKHDLTLEYGGENLYPHSSSWYVSDPTGHCIEVALWKDNTIRFGNQSWVDFPPATPQSPPDAPTVR